MPSSSWQPAACKEQQTSCRACNNSSTAFDPLCTIWKLCTLKTPCWECTEYAVTSSSHILPFKTFKDCFWLGPTKHPKLLVLLLQQWPRRGQSHLCICSCSSQALEAWQGNVQAIPAMAGLTWLMLATSIAMMKAEMTWTLHELGERKKRVNLFALYLKTLFPCWPLLVRNTSPNYKFIISIYFTYSFSLFSSALEVLELLSLLLFCSGAGAPPPPPLPPAAAPTAAAAAAAPAPSSSSSSSTRTTRTTTSNTKHQTSRTKHQTETPQQRHQAPEQHKHHQHRQHKHRHNWPPAQASASSDSKSKVMEVERGGCLAKQKRKYRLVYRFCIVLGIVWEGAISWQDWAS